MKQLTKNSATFIMMAICFFVLNGKSFANKNYDQLPLHTNLPAYLSPSIQVDIQWLSSSETVTLLVDNPAGKKITVILRDESGYILLKSFIPGNQTKLEKNYLFADAEEGKYCIEVCDGSKTIRKQIDLKRIIKRETVVSIL